jgi:hypothetical protein
VIFHFGNPFEPGRLTPKGNLVDQRCEGYVISMNHDFLCSSYG